MRPAVTTAPASPPVPVPQRAGAAADRRTSWVEARRRASALGASCATSTVAVALDAAHGLVLREPVHARVALPPHAASAMDGWAVAGEPPWLIGAPIDAGDAPPREPLANGTARPICTGAPLPPGTHGVLRRENGEERTHDGRRELHRTSHARRDEPRAAEHMRPSGEEALAGELLIGAGTPLTPPRIALSAAAGHDLLAVAARPRVDLLVLGDELVRSGLPRPGSIRDVVTPAFPAVLTALGAAAPRVNRCGDDRDATEAALAASDADLLIVTGGSSRGRTDHARAAARAVGVRWHVDQVAMRPGHPVAFGRRADGGAILLLPGNPFAAYAALLSFGEPILRGMLQNTSGRSRVVRLAESFGGHHGDTRLVAVSIQDDGARALDLQGSGMLRGLAAADGLAVVQPGMGATGDSVPLLSLPW